MIFINIYWPNTTVAALANLKSPDRSRGAGGWGRQVALNETIFFLLLMLENIHSHWPLGFCIKMLKFCSLNSKSKGIFEMPAFLDIA